MDDGAGCLVPGTGRWGFPAGCLGTVLLLFSARVLLQRSKSWKYRGPARLRSANGTRAEREKARLSKRDDKGRANKRQQARRPATERALWSTRPVVVFGLSVR
ncbi:hypothetical protein BD289DRAFT_17849 [Coniella lustricola]|uniref:Uncharacterized protein n=1 Tax=Coniella lustricola TaxID=2025994 RepID=A0A2T3AJ99_9PEZI|nr:hypothetical protein BD289DRAFT_17849 [Coniella lustricola]